MADPHKTATLLIAALGKTKGGMGMGMGKMHGLKLESPEEHSGEQEPDLAMEALKSASQDALTAIKADDAEAFAKAMLDVVKACEDCAAPEDDSSESD